MKINKSTLFTCVLLGLGVVVFASPPQPVPQQGQTPQPVVRQPVRSSQPVQVTPQRQPVRSSQPVQVTPQRQPVDSRSIVPQTKQPVKATPIQVAPPRGTAGKQPLSVTPPRGIDRHPVSTKGVEGYPVRGVSPTHGATRETPRRPVFAPVNGRPQTPKPGVTATGKGPVFAPGDTTAPVKGGVTQTSKPGSPSSTTTKTFERGVARGTETAIKPIDQKTGTTTKAISKPGAQVATPTGAITGQSLADKSKATAGTQRTPTTTVPLAADKLKPVPLAKQTATTLANAVTQDKIEKAILKHTNEARVKQGLPPLKVSPTLETLADIHSNNQAYAGKMAHDSDKFPVGFQTAAERIKKVDIGTSYSTHENVLFNSAKPPTTDAGLDSYAKTLVTQWMNSPPHKANILSADSKYLGIGIKDGYATQVFASAEGKFKPGAMPPPTTTQPTTTPGTVGVSPPTTTGSPPGGKTTTTPGGKTTATGPVTSGTTTGTAPTGTNVPGGISAIPEIKPTGSLVMHADDRANGPIYVYSDGTRVQHTYRDPEVRTVISSKLGETRIYRDGTRKTFPPKSTTATTAATGTGASSGTSGLTPVKIPQGAPTMHLDDFKNGPIYVYSGGVSVQNMIGDTNIKTVVKSANAETHYYKDGSSKTFPPKSGTSTTPATGTIRLSKSGLSGDDKTAIQQTAKQSIAEGLGKTAVDSIQGKSTDNLKNVMDSFTSNLDKKSVKDQELDRKFKEKLAQIKEKRAKDAAQTPSPVADSPKETQKSSSSTSKDKVVTATPDKSLTQANKEKLTALEDRKKWLESRTFSPTTHDNVPALEAKRQEELSKINAQIKELKAPAAVTSGEKTSVKPTSGQTTPTAQANSGKSIADALNILTEGGKQQSIEMVQNAYKMMHDPAVAKEAAPYLASFDRNYTTFMNAMKASAAPPAAPKASNAGAISSLQGQVADIDKKLAVNQEGWKNVDPQDTSTKNALFKQEAELLASREQIRAQIHRLKAEDQAVTPSKASGSSGTATPTGTPSGGTSHAPKATGQSSPAPTTARGVTMPPTDTSPPDTDSGFEPPLPPDFSGGQALIAANDELWARLPEGDPLRRVLEAENARLRGDIIRGNDRYRDELASFEEAQRASTQETSEPSETPSEEKSEDPFKLVRDLIETWETGGIPKSWKEGKIIIDQIQEGVVRGKGIYDNLTGAMDFLSKDQKNEAEKEEKRIRREAEGPKPFSNGSGFEGLDTPVNKTTPTQPTDKDTSGGFDDM